MRDLGGGNFVGVTLTAFEADLLGGDRLEAAAIVQDIAFWVPKNGIDIEKITPQELFDGEGRRALGHVGVFFHAPEIEQDAVGTNAALYSAESIRRKAGISQLALNLLNGARARDHDVDVGRLGFNSLDAFEQQIAQQTTHHKGAPFRRKKSKHGAEIAACLSALEIAQGTSKDVRRPKAAIRCLWSRLCFERHVLSLGLALQFYSSILCTRWSAASYGLHARAVEREILRYA